jgi:transposase, IS30 family
LTPLGDGLLRQYLPKGTDFSGLSQRHLTNIATALDKRPKKCLGFRTPQEAMNCEIRGLIATAALQA